MRVLCPVNAVSRRVQDQENIKVEERRGSITKAAIVTLADTASNEDLGRMVNALSVGKEFKEEGH